ncbi:MAG: hypothetical protein ACI8WB_004530 [Phenylobacterium sp.]
MINSAGSKNPTPRIGKRQAIAAGLFYGNLGKQYHKLGKNQQRSHLFKEIFLSANGYLSPGNFELMKTA